MRFALNALGFALALIGAIGAVGLCIAPAVAHAGFDAAVRLFTYSLALSLVGLPGAVVLWNAAGKRA
jgi:hypothetical protein